MDINNNTSIKSLIINRKIVYTPVYSCFFFMLLAEMSPELFPKQKEYFLFHNLSL